MAAQAPVVVVYGPGLHLHCLCEITGCPAELFKESQAQWQWRMGLGRRCQPDTSARLPGLPEPPVLSLGKHSPPRLLQNPALPLLVFQVGHLPPPVFGPLMLPLPDSRSPSNYALFVQPSGSHSEHQFIYFAPGLRVCPSRKPLGHCFKGMLCTFCLGSNPLPGHFENEP